MKINKKLMLIFSLIFVLFVGVGLRSVASAACPGDGPAKPVSSVRCLDYYKDDKTNHLYVRIEVMGYGTDYVYINNSRVRPDTLRTKFIIKTCNGADGFEYHFDCGSAIKGKTYQIKARFDSHNWPYTSKSTSCHFTY